MDAQTTPTTGLAGRYATAVLALAQEARAADALGAELTQLQALLTQSADLSRLVRSAAISREDQAKAIASILERAKAGDLTRKLILLLTAKRRLYALGDVIRAYQALLARSRGEVATEITSARPLSDHETTALRAALKTKLGREPKLSLRVEPNILGGLKLKLGSRMIDSSLRTKLDGLARAMKGR